ncbi:gp643 [Bacillus phage G]|uniref:Gp643 n=1 Tax=Bacillus phage G TaxID=2884420 RepID=G3MB23_9CAUD|nr:gp643 [Bacillus phage G]AEO93886.1 gp643 [Bacillus phage G]
MRLNVRRRHKPDIIEQRKAENLKRKDEVDKVEELISNAFLMKALVNGWELKINKPSHYAVPVIEVEVNGKLILDITFKQQEISEIWAEITMSHLEYKEKFEEFNYRYSSSYCLKNDTQITKFMDIMAECYEHYVTTL